MFLLFPLLKFLRGQVELLLLFIGLKLREML